MARLRAVLFDLDGTLVRYCGVEFESSWGAIAAAAGVTDASKELLAEYLPRRDAYADWVRRDAALLAGIDVGSIVPAVFPPPLAEGVREVIDALRGRYLLGIVSSGVDLVANQVRDDLGLDFSLANHLAIEDGRFSGDSEVRVDLWNKAKVVRGLIEERNIDPQQVCYVGDHVNDIPVLQMVGLGIAIHAKDPTVAAAAAHSADGFAELPGLIAAYESAAPAREHTAAI
jgi:phosphoserine phosphatase